MGKQVDLCNAGVLAFGVLFITLKGAEMPTTGKMRKQANLKKMRSIVESE